ncbi:mitochondrial carrier domain-containing protein [Bipolaris maydis]|nr:mitochondrial carrier domain-containing protein [Bipolaris maydis]KAJ6197457.1 mitochondrial carrier domain-containing protein [Bipolaris maydis]KAJ6209565.1 mitochondrial carrier domain-containing protein [Bipolaris maydis]
MEAHKSSVAVLAGREGLPNTILMEEAQRPAAPHVTSSGEEALKDILCGSTAGIVGKYIEYPFDTVKVRLQSQPDTIPLRYSGPLDCFKKSLQHDGFLGIYRGISAPLVGAAVESSTLFFSYRIAGDALKASGVYPELKRHPERDLPYSGMLWCGMVAGAITSLFLTPIELVKCKMQVPVESPGTMVATPTIRGVIASIYRHQGLSGYWHGQLGTLIRETGGGAAWFGGYEGMKIIFKRINGSTKDEDLRVWQRMASGSVAGGAYNFMFYPADTIKSRMQTEDVKYLTGGKSSFTAVGKALWKQHGIKGMYRGCGITVARSIPSSAFIFTVYEELKKRWPSRGHARIVSWQSLAGVLSQSQTNVQTLFDTPYCLHVQSKTAHTHTTAAMDQLHALHKIALDPKYHDVLTLVKGVRNGIVYGSKVRFPHALVMIFLFRSGSFRSKCLLVYKATRQHARNLGLFALVYKATMLLLRHTSPNGKERQYDSFLAGLLGGYTVFGRTIHNSVSQQIVIYVAARVCLALAKLAVQPRDVGSAGGKHAAVKGWELFGNGEMRRALVRNGWPAFASLSWAMVMYIFRWHPESVQSSLRSSMSYIYVQSDEWDSLRTLLWHNK